MWKPRARALRYLCPVYFNLSVMKQLLLLLYALAATLLCAALARRHRAEERRWRDNCAVLADQSTRLRMRADSQAASVEALRLRCREYEALRAADADRIRALGIRLRDLEAAARSTLATSVELRTPLHDTVVVRLRDTLAVGDTLRRFGWRDPWVTVEGCIDGDSVACRVESIDTLRQIVHRIPRRFLFIRWGTRALRQEIRSSNPHSRIVSTEYIQIER